MKSNIDVLMANVLANFNGSQDRNREFPVKECICSS